MWVSDGVKKKMQERCDAFLQCIKDSGISYSQVGIFGSYARKEYKAHSDIDFCIVTDREPTKQDRGTLRCDAEEYDCDLIFVSEERFAQEDSLFMRNLRRDYIRVL